MITRRKRRRYLVLAIVLAILTGSCSLWFPLEPSASEDSRNITLLDESLMEEEGSTEDEILNVQVLSAESTVYSTCDGESSIVLDGHQEIGFTQVSSAMVTLEKAKAKKDVKPENTDEATRVGIVETEKSEEESSEEETYDENASDEETWDDWYEDSYEEPTYEEPVYEEPAQEESRVETPAETPVQEESSSSTTDTSAPQAAPETTVEESTAQEPEKEPEPDPNYTDLDYLAAICQIEAGYNYEGCLAVANAVLNRLKAGYADTIFGVIYAPYQFATDNMDYYLKNGTGEEARRAAQDAMNGINNLGDYRNFNGTYWLDPATLDCPYVVIGGNCFY